MERAARRQGGRGRGHRPGDLRLSVGIAYLCGQLPTRAGHVVVTLAGCEQFEYRSYQEQPESDPPAVAALGLDLLSAGIADGAVSVECADGWSGGQLVTRYASARVATAEGGPLSQAELEAAADRYWSLWQQKHAGPSDAPDPARDIGPGGS